MGFFEGDYKWQTNPYAAPGIGAIEDWGKSVGLGKAGKAAKGIINQISSGNYGGLAGSILSPISNRYATQMREAIRANSMGGNAFAQGAQPALMAAIEQDTRRKMAESEGLAYAEAIPQLFSSASNVYQNANNARDSSQLSALEAAIRARLGASQMTQGMSGMQKFGNILGMAQNVASLI
jgi:hypothetical protein